MTYRGFQTWEDAKTFKDFLIQHGFEKVSISKDSSYYKVFFKDR